MTVPRSGIWLGLSAALIAVMGLSLLTGRVWLSPLDWLAGDTRALIILELRLPRAVLGCVIGAGLGMAGAAMQGYLRNPLADPGLFGVSSSAALGAVLSIFFGLTNSFWLLPAFALAGAAGAMGALALLVGRSGGLMVFTLAGVVLSSLTGALTSLVISLAPSPFALSEILTWLLGALTDRSWVDVALAAPLTALGMALLWASGRDLDALTLGEPAARSLGVHMSRLQAKLVIGIGLVVGASVAAAGVIGFVGLIVPHLVRQLVGGQSSRVMPAAALAGAILVVSADGVVRLAPGGSELRLGIAMSLLGAPFFLALLLRLRREVV